jgi:Na+-driven multidrug efflux pump
MNTNYIAIVLIIVLEIAVIHSIAQYIGTKRKIGYGKSVFWSIVLTPIIGLIITLSSKKIDNQ